MAYTIRFSSKAEREIEELPAHIQKRVARWMALLAIDPYRSPSIQLEGYSELRRVHAVKDYVIVYSVFAAEVVVLGGSGGAPAGGLPGDLTQTGGRKNSAKKDRDFAGRRFRA